MRVPFDWRWSSPKLPDKADSPCERSGNSPATFDEHEGDTITEHRFVNVLSSPCSSW